MKKRHQVCGCGLLQGVTPYPWQRNHRGDLCGAHGRPIYFSGADAVLVEYSPEMAETLVKIRATAAAHHSSSTVALNEIFQSADELITRIEKAKAERKWCRGIIRS